MTRDAGPRDSKVLWLSTLATYCSPSCLAFRYSPIVKFASGPALAALLMQSVVRKKSRTMVYSLWLGWLFSSGVAEYFSISFTAVRAGSETSKARICSGVIRWSISSAFYSHILLAMGLLYELIHSWTCSFAARTASNLTFKPLGFSTITKRKNLERDPR